jgi:hypothetical protein
MTFRTSPLSPSDVHALLHEKLEALLQESEQVMDNAAHGQLLNDLDDFFFIKGKKTSEKFFNRNFKNASNTSTTPKRPRANKMALICSLLYADQRKNC